MNKIYVVSLSGSDVFSKYTIEGFLTSINNDTINNTLKSIAKKYNITFGNIESHYGFFSAKAINRKIVLTIEPTNKIA